MAVLTGFVLNPPGVERTLGIIVGIKAEELREEADRNASGQVIQVRSDRLRKGIKAFVGPGPEGPVVGVVGTDAFNPATEVKYPEFNYPSHLESEGFHWLSDAARRVFPGV